MTCLNKMFADRYIEEVPRLVYELPNNYSSKTLIGTWVDDRARYVKKTYKHTSSFSKDYPEKPPSYVHPNVIWNHKIQAEGLGPRILMDHEGTKYHDNFSTTYDLSYNYIPRMRKCRPHDLLNKTELIENYGNVTQSGLHDYMKVKWKNDSIDPDPPLRSEMQDAYQCYERKDYTTKRFAANRELSSKMFTVNEFMARNPPRGCKVLTAPDNLIHDIPRYPHCPLRIHENPCKIKLIHKDYKLKELIT